MKLIGHFDTFLSDVVNLNKTRIDLLDDSIEAIKTVIRGSDWAPHIRGFAAQGSWAHKTIIRPVEGAAFDADLLAYVDDVSGWTAKTYLDELYAVFNSLDLYKDKVRRFSHCVTIEYAEERKIDIAPCVANRNGVAGYEVCNRSLDRFEKSNPIDYTDWIIQRNAWSGSNSFRKVARLIKYLRDIKTTFTCPSVLLTTILGHQITAIDLEADEFVDAPTALVTVMGRLDNWLQANVYVPTVRNPVLFEEVFSTAWDETKYSNFREKIHTYREWMDDAYSEPDRDESIGKWRRVFGDDFAKSIALDEATGVSSKALTLMKGAMLGTSSLAGDLVNLVRAYGTRALPPGFNRLPHMQRPRWRSHLNFAASISAGLYESKEGRFVKQVASLEVVPKEHWLKFQARTQTGMPIGDTFEIHWRVTNTDYAAAADDALRGDFYDSNAGSARWEQLRYRGVHLVEAFIVQKRDHVLVAQSAPFYVTIE